MRLRAWVIDGILWRQFIEPTFDIGSRPPQLPEELMSDHEFAVAQALRVDEAHKSVTRCWGLIVQTAFFAVVGLLVAWKMSG